MLRKIWKSDMYGMIVLMLALNCSQPIRSKIIVVGTAFQPRYRLDYCVSEIRDRSIPVPARQV